MPVRPLALACAAVVLAACSGGSGPTTSTDVAVVPPADPVTCTTIDCVVEAGYELLRAGSFDDAISYVEEASMRLSPASGSFCHDALHRLGVRSGAAVPTARSLVACAGGFAHGAFTVLIGTGGVQAVVDACRGFSGEDSVLCRHGYGHAAAADGDLTAIPDRCAAFVAADPGADTLGVGLGQLCADGAFMEIVAKVQLGALELADPVAYCADLTGDPAWGCWRQLPVLAVRDGRVDGGVLGRVVEACNRLEPALSIACAVGVAGAVAASDGDVSWCARLTEHGAFCADRAGAVQAS